jgi:hypothetical protein
VADLSDILAAFEPQTLTVTRGPVMSPDTNGRYQPTGSPTTLSISAVVWPASGDDLSRLPAGQSDSETLMFATTTQLWTANNTTTTKADRITVPSHGVFELEDVQDWAGHAGIYIATGRKVASL